METKTKLRDWFKKVTENKEAIDIIDNSEERIVRAYKELLSGYDVITSKILKVTKKVKNHEGIIVQTDINFYSICGHHFLPFHGTICLAYEPGEVIVGIGKLKRLVDAYSRRLQIQEDLVKEIAEELMKSGKAKGAYVLAKGTHHCMCSRGPQDDTTQTTTTYSCGSLKGIEQERRILNLFSK